MQKYLLAGILFYSLSFETTAQASKELKEAAASPATEESIVTEIPASESILSGYTAAGQLHYRAQIKNKRLHGKWLSWYDNGNTCDSGNLVKGLPDGEWKVWYPNGNIRFVRNYKAENFERVYHEIIRYNPKTSRFALSDLYYKNRKTASTKMSGYYGFPQTSYTLPPDKPALIAAANTRNQKSYHPVFEKALLHGLYVNYNEDGSIKDSGHYENGLQQGLWTEDAVTYYSKGWYEKGLRNKQWKTYNRNGEIVRIEEYKMGKLVWKKEFTN